MKYRFDQYYDFKSLFLKGLILAIRTCGTFSEEKNFFVKSCFHRLFSAFCLCTYCYVIKLAVEPKVLST